MTPENAYKGAALATEIKELLIAEERIKKINSIAHFAVVSDFGQLNENEMIRIDPKYNHLFIDTLQRIIANLKQELDRL
jgi:hypothetical protein